MEDHSRPVLSLAISNGKIYSGSYDYNIKAGTDLTFLISAVNHALSSSFTNRVLIPHLPPPIQVWDLNSLMRIKTLSGHTDAVRALAVAGGRLFSGSYDGTVRVWDEASLNCIEVLKGHVGPVRTLVHCR